MQLEIEESALKMNQIMQVNIDQKNYKKNFQMKKKNKRHYNLVQNKKKKNRESSRKRAELDRSRQALEDAQTESNYEKAAELQYGTIPQLEKELKEYEEVFHDEQGDNERMIREVVSDEEIGDIVSQWTGIPVSKLVETEREKLLNLSDILHERVVGQDKSG